jgi:MoxR-like ATPase
MEDHVGSAPGLEQPVSRFADHAREHISKVIVGQQEMVEQCLLALLVGGHVLLEGVPGVAKTLTVKTIAQMLALEFQRVQSTSDLMPADIIGTSVFQQNTNSFELHRGPVFGDLLLVDEINRMPPRTQAALLESMEERQVTIDGKRHQLHATFTVFATQNPVDFEGTYPLPEAQLDRFLLKCLVPYPSPEDELKILELHCGGGDTIPAQVAPLPESLLRQAREQVMQVKVETTLMQYVVRLVGATRVASQLTLGASPRAALNLLAMSKARAALDGRDYVIPEDVKQSALPTLRHRLMLRPDAQLEGVTTDQAIADILKSVELPR